MIGTQLSHYLLLERLGGGGQGVVFRARDERLHRDVAIKVLPAGALAQESDRKQFRKEALNLSRLNHPHIQTIHDFDTQDGVDYLVLELVPGPTLEDRIREGPLSEEEIARLGAELAEGLDAAHAEGIYHRDIKPSNLKITASGRLKILDFGLAKRLAPVSDGSMTETVSGVSGTVPYMAPEQIRGGAPDARSDIHAVGAVLYEMACGRRAFPQESQPAAIAAILGDAPTPLRELRPGLSRGLEEIIRRCLEKDPARRYQGARDLAEDLKREPPRTGSRRALPPGRIVGSRARIAAISLATVLVVGAVLVALNVGGLRTRLLGSAVPKGERSLAVLPMVNLSGDPGQEYFADGMTDELITRLAQIRALRVISRSSVMTYKGSKKPLRQIAKDLNVALVVEGSVARSGDRVRVSATLIDPFAENHLWADSYQRTLSDVLLLEGDLARSIVEKIQVSLTPREETRLAAAAPVNPEALHAYLRGQYEANQNWSMDGLRRARQEFENAIRIDPTYAPAHAGLGRVYYDLSGNALAPAEAMPRARAALQRAIELDPQLASAYANLSLVQAFYDRDWKEAERSCLRAIDLGPGEAAGHQTYGALLTSQGRFQDAERELALARSIDPLSGTVAQMSLWPLFEGRQYERAAQAAAELVAADPKSAGYRLVLGQALLYRGETRRAIAELRTCIELEPEMPFLRGWLAYAYGFSGDRASAKAELERIERWKSGYVQPYILAIAHIGAGQYDQALTSLEKAADERSDELFFLKVDPALDALRPNPRFQALMKRMGFTA